jgi:hypothetical protein
MNDVAVHIPNLSISVAASEQMRSLLKKYDRSLAFHIVPNAEGDYLLRIHDTVYNADFVLEINEVAVSLPRKALTQFLSLQIGWMKKQGAVEEDQFILSENDKIVASLGISEACTRIESQEVEVCDAYGEYCYQTYT